jgi:YidC/Oxa1 family membrane protein insertase
MIAFFKTILFFPILNAVVLLYHYLPPHDLGIVIIVLTFIIRLILSPLSYKAARTQKKISKIQPKIKEIKEKYKDNKEEQAQKLMEVYKKHKVNPLTGLLPLLVQLPIIIALYRVFINIIENDTLKGLYAFVPNPGTIDPTFLGILNLGEKSLIIALIAGGLQFVYSRLAMGSKKQKDKKSFSEVLQKDDFKFKDLKGAMGSQMTYFMPAFAVVIGATLPAGLPLYWATSTLFRVGEQLLVKKNKDKEDEKKQSKGKEKPEEESEENQKENPNKNSEPK